MTKRIVTQKLLKELLHYDPRTGLFTWVKKRARTSFKVGDVAGGFDSDGYICITINNSQYLAHRLAFLYMTGKFPDNQVDHDNHCRDDNRWKNLNPATNAANNKNKSMPKNNTSGCVGVCWGEAANRWMAYIYVKRKRIHLGYFTHKTDAVNARKEANIKYGFHKNHGS